MVESVGKKLQQSRLQRGLTIDEAAHATKLRPDKIAALENDDYSRFANNIYAKGFLQIYGRFLKVDVEDFARTLDNSNPISISDYQYLSNAPAAKHESISVRREERRPPSLAPLFFFVILVAGGLAFVWGLKNWERIQGDPAAKTSAPSESTPMPIPAVNPDAAFVAGMPSSAPGIPGAQAIVPAEDPGAAASAPDLAPVASDASLATTPIAAATPPARMLDQDFVEVTPVAGTETAANATPPNGVNEVLVAAAKTTWVTVRKDDPKAPPIFEDYVYSNAPPLKLKGARFFIEARDPTVIQITKNGLPFAYQAPGQPVQ